MEEIRVYHSFWKRLLQSIFYIVSYSALIWIFSINKDLDDIAGVLKIFLIITCFFCVLYGIYLLFELLWEKFGHRPYMVITDKGIAVNTLLKKRFIDFADVVRFDVKQYVYSYILIAYYKPEASMKMLDDSNTIQNIFFKRNIYQEVIKLMFIDKDVAILCIMLNERLSKQSASRR